jgi:hypothetical protein
MNNCVCQSCDIFPETSFPKGTNRDLPEVSDVVELHRSLPSALSLLGINDEQCAVFTDGCKRTYFHDEALRDKAISFAGNCGTLPFVFSAEENRPASAGHGVAIYEIKPGKLKYAVISYSRGLHYSASYIVVSRKDAKAVFEHFAKQNEEYNKKQLIDHPPLLPSGFLEEILKNSIDFLTNYQKFVAYGTRPARGLVLRGDPGNGKTMTCKWIQVLAKKHDLTVHTYTTADIEAYYKDDMLPSLMTAANIIFFDDIDISFLSRRKGNDSNSKMACALLSAMDGIGDNKKGVARIFTTNEKVTDIDPAFLRPGRIDKVLTFMPPDAKLRRQVVDSYWHKDIVQAINIDNLVSASEGFSFADLEEVKMLLVQGFVFDGAWNLNKALEDFKHRKDMKADMELAAKQEEEKKS